jgi:hypothetical protein
MRINNPMKILSERFRKDYFTEGWPLKKLFNRPWLQSGITVKPRLAKLLFTILFLLCGLRSVAPDSNTMIVFQPKPIQPFNELMYAIGMVETMGNVSAYNEIENAVGKFQIRQVRIDDFNRRTGSKFVLEDMFDSGLSEKVFLYFASQIGPYHLEKIAKNWNGSGPKTDYYWKRIKAYLE